MSLKIIQLAVSLKIKVLHNIIEQQLPVSPYSVGNELASEVHKYSHQNKLGYYPALEYFHNKEIDKDLFASAENISWLVCNMIREELQKRLRPVFSSLSFESLQNIAFTLPRVRIGESNDLHKLAAHYTPDHVKVNLITSLLRKEMNTLAAEQYTRAMLNRWLKERFAEFEVSSITAI